jgi:hypothetical protein
MTHVETSRQGLLDLDQKQMSSESVVSMKSPRGDRMN